MTTQKRLIHLHLYNGSGDAFPEAGVTTVLEDGREELDRRTHDKVAQFVKYNVSVNDVDEEQAFRYRVVAWADGTKHAAVGPLVLKSENPRPVHLMLLPDKPRFKFPSFDGLSKRSFSIHNVFKTNDPNGDLYTRAAQEQEAAMATVFNVLSAVASMDETNELIGFYREIFKTRKNGQDVLEIRPDRFYAKVDPKLQDRISNNKMLFSQEPTGDHKFTTASGKVFTPISQASFKEKRYGEANVQFIFYKVDNDIVVENDMDLFRSLLKHLVFELVPNDIVPFFSGQPQRLTDAHQIYWRRWMVSRNDANPRVFAPPVAVVSA